jgi:hypothetical protein
VGCRKTRLRIRQGGTLITRNADWALCLHRRVHPGVRKIQPRVGQVRICPTSASVVELRARSSPSPCGGLAARFVATRAMTISRW